MQTSHVSKIGEYTYRMFANHTAYRVTVRADGYFVEPEFSSSRRLYGVEEFETQFPGATAEINKLTYR